MIVKIQPPSSMLEATLFYNERKADGKEGVRKEDDELLDKENGHIVATRNVADGKTLEEEFERLAILNSKKTRGRKLENPAFHMSVNPGPDDAPLSEAAIVSLVDEIMLKMGYEECPYRIYKHTDTDRVHYHVVSTRIGQDGKKINDAFENRRVNRVAEELSTQYGYTVGLDEEKIKNNLDKGPGINEPSSSEKSESKKKQKAPYVPPFRTDGETPLSEQMRNIHKDAMTWTFSTPEQYKAILRYRYNVLAEEYEDGIHVTGIDKTGKTNNIPLTENELGLRMTEDIIKKCSSDERKKRTKEKERISQIALSEMKESGSVHEFRKKMLSKGIFLIISYTDEGVPFGITWLDKVTRCAFKGSELTCDLDWLKQTASDRQWNLEKVSKKTPQLDRRQYEKKETQSTGQKEFYRATDHIRKSHEKGDLEALLKDLGKKSGEESDAPAIDKSSLNNDPNNIKI